MGLTKVTGDVFDPTSDLQVGVITATKFIGDGTEITGVSGFASAISNDSGSILNRVFTTQESEIVAAGTSVTIQASELANYIAFTRANTIIVSAGATFHIAAGSTFVTNVLGIF